jgi:DNA processing protein
MIARELTPEALLGPLNETERKHAPKVLYASGDLEILSRGGRVAIVGSRKASADGLKRASRLARLLSEQGVVVVSGLAEGIDTAAHEAAIRHGGRTIAVIGTPLDKAYPAKNRALQDEIARSHLLLSQFAPAHPVTKASFPQRNRTMALICDVSVIIEAGNSSGTLSQGWEALRLGRPLFIMRAVVEDVSLNWPREMLQYGAQILSDQGLEEFLIQIPPREPQREAAIAF